MKRSSRAREGRREEEDRREGQSHDDGGAHDGLPMMTKGKDDGGTTRGEHEEEYDEDDEDEDDQEEEEEVDHVDRLPRAKRRRVGGMQKRAAGHDAQILAISLHRAAGIDRFVDRRRSRTSPGERLETSRS